MVFCACVSPPFSPLLVFDFRLLLGSFFFTSNAISLRTPGCLSDPWQVWKSRVYRAGLLSVLYIVRPDTREDMMVCYPEVIEELEMHPYPLGDHPGQKPVDLLPPFMETMLTFMPLGFFFACC